MSDTATVTETPAPTRLVGLDRLRGLAMVSMGVDHLAFLIGAAAMPARVTAGRLALPLFALVVGACTKPDRPLPSKAWQWALAFVAAVPAYGLLGMPGALILVFLFFSRITASGPLWVRQLIVVLALVVGANGMAPHAGGEYDPLMVAGLVCLGSMIPLHLATLGNRLPRWLAGPGRHALAFYVAHLWALAGIAWMVTR